MNTIKLLLALSLMPCIGVDRAHANCPYPERPLVEIKGEEVLSLNSYRPGSSLCIVQFLPENCPKCRKGWRHRCEAEGEWAPKEECLPSEKKKAMQELQNGKSSGSRPAVSPDLTAMQNQMDELQRAKRVDRSSSETSGRDDQSGMNGHSNCPNDVSAVLPQIRSPEIRQSAVGVNIDAAIAAGGGLSAAKSATRAQIMELQNKRPAYQAAGGQTREIDDALTLNQYVLQAMECRGN